MIKKIIKSSILFLLLIVFFLSNNSCAPRYSYHGNYFSKKEINFLKNTRLSKAEILQLLGNPSTKTTFSDSIWYYITQVRKERAYFSVDNISTTVLRVTFNNNNLVKNYKLFTDDSSINIDINQDKTQSALEKDESFIKDFFTSFRRRLLNPIK